MVKINDIVYNSRAVKKGDLFCAIKGFAVDGNDFIDMAIEKGAVAILSENDHPTNGQRRWHPSTEGNFHLCNFGQMQDRNHSNQSAPTSPLCGGVAAVSSADGVVWIKCDNVKQEMAKIAKNHYGVNFDEIFCVATTGTNGKTSIATITYEILSQIFNENHTFLLGTAGNKICGEFFEAQRTTPEAIDTLKMLGTAKNKIKALSMEASSHALVLDRLTGFNFDLAIFTNLTQDHLDFHKTMEEYYQAKKRLFTEHLKPNGIAIINIDDEYGRRLFGELNCKKFSVGFSYSFSTFGINLRVITYPPLIFISMVSGANIFNELLLLFASDGVIPWKRIKAFVKLSGES